MPTWAQNAWIRGLPFLVTTTHPFGLQVGWTAKTEVLTPLYLYTLSTAQTIITHMFGMASNRHTISANTRRPQVSQTLDQVHDLMKGIPLSRTHKLIAQITQVCKEILDIKTSNIITRNLSQPKPPYNHKGSPSDKYVMGDVGCTHSGDNKSHGPSKDPQNNLNIPVCHAAESPSPPEPLPPELPEWQSSHASEPAFSSEASASCELPPSLTEDDNTALQLMDCNCSQRESQDNLGMMGLREGWEVEHLGLVADGVKASMVVEGKSPTTLH